MTRAGALVFLSLAAAALVTTIAHFEPHATDRRREQGGSRPSVTFVMGEDKSKASRFYSNAALYFKRDPLEHTDLVVTHLRSLESIRDFLADEANGQGAAWGLVNIVVHGNPWTGLSVPIAPGGERTDAASLRMAASAAYRLGERVDNGTTIRVLGCGAGKDESLGPLVARFFTGNDQPAVVVIPEFLVFQEEPSGKITRSTAEFWHIYYAAGFRPADITMSREFKGRYPDDQVPWRNALTERDPSAGLFHMTFDLPVEWIVTYEHDDDLPAILTKEAQSEWLSAQDGLRETINASGLDPDRFTWHFSRRRIAAADGTLRPAVRALGITTAIVVLRNRSLRLMVKSLNFDDELPT